MKRTLTSADLALITVAKTYSSREEFERKNKGKYLIARSKNLLKIAYPVKQENISRLQLPTLKKGIKGIYVLYIEDTVIYIGKSLLNCNDKIHKHIMDGLEPTKCEVYEIEHEPDIHVLEVYLINLHQPTNNKTYKNSGTLTIHISNLTKIMGEPIVTTTKDYKQVLRTRYTTIKENKQKQVVQKKSKASSNIKNYFNSK